MSILSNLGLRTYKPVWIETSREKFDAEDIEVIESITVVASNYGLSGEILWVSKEVSYIPLSRECRDVVVGETINPEDCWIVHLERAGETTEKLLVL